MSEEYLGLALIREGRKSGRAWGRCRCTFQFGAERESEGKIGVNHAEATMVAATTPPLSPFGGVRRGVGSPPLLAQLSHYYHVISSSVEGFRRNGTCCDEVATADAARGTRQP